jgi:hypothetical protein
VQIKFFDSIPDLAQGQPQFPGSSGLNPAIPDQGRFDLGPFQFLERVGAARG